ncbi:MAG: hypothetical protein JWM16_682 [Verrucomicrobiales bacterium]|nr:hypothetical protein [Verrucomicrobiales bacterium]
MNSSSPGSLLCFEATNQNVSLVDLNPERLEALEKLTVLQSLLLIDVAGGGPAFLDTATLKKFKDEGNVWDPRSRPGWDQPLNIYSAPQKVD